MLSGLTREEVQEKEENRKRKKKKQGNPKIWSSLSATDLILHVCNHKYEDVELE